MKDTIKVALRLLIITVVAGLALGFTNSITEEPIKEQERIAGETARQAVLDADSFTELPLEELKNSGKWDAAFDAVIGVYQGEKGGEYAGMVVVLDTKGYGGAIRLTVGVDAENQVSGVNIGSHGETPGLGAKAANASFTDQYQGSDAGTPIQLGAAGNNSIEAISGATVTSRSVTDGVNVANQVVQIFGKGE